MSTQAAGTLSCPGISNSHKKSIVAVRRISSKNCSSGAVVNCQAAPRAASSRNSGRQPRLRARGSPVVKAKSGNNNHNSSHQDRQHGSDHGPIHHGSILQGHSRGENVAAHVASSALGAAAGTAAIVAALGRTLAAISAGLGTAAVAAGALGGVVVGEVLLKGAREEDLETDRDVERGMEEAAERVVHRLRAAKAEGGFHPHHGGGGTGTAADAHAGSPLAPPSHHNRHPASPDEDRDSGVDGGRGQ